MQKQIEQYIENIKKDYVGWGNPKTDTERTVRDNMVKEFCESIDTFDNDKYNYIRKKTLDAGNDIVRELEQNLEKLEIRIK